MTYSWVIRYLSHVCIQVLHRQHTALPHPITVQRARITVPLLQVGAASGESAVPSVCSGCFYRVSGSPVKRILPKVQRILTCSHAYSIHAILPSSSWRGRDHRADGLLAHAGTAQPAGAPRDLTKDLAPGQSPPELPEISPAYTPQGAQYSPTAAAQYSPTGVGQYSPTGALQHSPSTAEKEKEG